jgi:TPP-dependent pyruvate/acetoin dehydrogenase alpha subunit
MEGTTLELIETVIFWEKHTEIYDSLEKFLEDRFIVTKEDKKAIKEIISEFMAAQMDQAEDFRQLDPKIFEKYTITKK